MADDSREKFINPYSVLDDLDFLDETKVNWESEESKKVYWDNYSVMKTAIDKGFHIGVMKVKPPLLIVCRLWAILWNKSPRSSI